jgi:formamidopyrimidine-DNA glycosylase
MNITYHRNGDYLLPDLALGNQPTAPLTKYGRMRMRFLQEHKPGLYSHLILSGKLYWHLVETQEAAQARIDRIVEEMAKSAGIDEKLKARDQMAWVGAMNAIRQQAEEIVMEELIYG